MTMDSRWVRIYVLAQSRRPVARFIALCLLSALLLANLWWAKPHFNWDLIGYVGAAYSFTSRDAESIHGATFTDIAQNVPAETYAALTTGSPFRSAIAEDPKRFAQQLPFYSGKPVYPALMRLGAEFGYSLTAVSAVIPQAAYCLIALLVYLWLGRHYAPLLAFVAASLLVSMPFVLELARYSTPDALSTLVILVACFVRGSQTASAGGKRPCVFRSHTPGQRVARGRLLPRHVETTAITFWRHAWRQRGRPYLRRFWSRPTPETMTGRYNCTTESSADSRSQRRRKSISASSTICLFLLEPLIPCRCAVLHTAFHCSCS